MARRLEGGRRSRQQKTEYGPADPRNLSSKRSAAVYCIRDSEGIRTLQEGIGSFAAEGSYPLGDKRWRTCPVDSSDGELVLWTPAMENWASGHQ
ncbi:hypothetical protein NHX12_008437 [Muraenolepis orangiensis]|uniref:Uncharacterized protein n=1 Tax=Muraenolepis orangiensis TaxID=630683 RepID=A0A9Q0IB92_9TELE|nr:hypothetical protein NHX12_008437 [Muraenolepis orangiensis]